MPSSNNDKKNNAPPSSNGGGAEPRQLTDTEAAIIEMMKRQANMSGARLDEQSLLNEDKKHAFWDTQPMPHGEREKHPEGPIEPDKKPEEIRADPYKMPTGFEWSSVDITNTEIRDELYELLANNYVEDNECMFRFDYSREFLQWALTPPGFNVELLLGVRATKTKKLVAFISAIPAKIHVYKHCLERTVEINFLCVHKKLRSKRLAPVLIKEITRRVNKLGIFQAVYTAGVVLPVPAASARYYHRSLNPKKLVRVNFSRVPPKMTMARFIKMYKLPATTSSKLQPMKEEHVQGVHQLLLDYLKKFSLHIEFSEEEIAHWMLPRAGVIDSFVIVNDDGKVTDFCSFYHLPSSILNLDETLNAAYSFYNVATSMPLVDLMRDALIMANSIGTDVFNALTLMENTTFLDELKFGKGDGNLQYYIYNWACPTMESRDVGLVLL